MIGEFFEWESPPRGNVVHRVWLCVGAHRGCMTATPPKTIIFDQAYEVHPQYGNLLTKAVFTCSTEITKMITFIIYLCMYVRIKNK